MGLNRRKAKVAAAEGGQESFRGMRFGLGTSFGVGMVAEQPAHGRQDQSAYVDAEKRVKDGRLSGSLCRVSSTGVATSRSR